MTCEGLSWPKAVHEEIKVIDATARIKKAKMPDGWQSNSVTG